MRPTGTAAAIGLALAATVLTVQLSGQSVVQSAHADDPTIPSRGELREAAEAALDAAGDVDSVRAALAAAGQRLESSSIAAAQAAEGFNGARWQAQEARKASRLAERAAAVAAADHERQSDFYADTVVAAYETMPELSGLTAVLESDDLATLLERSSTLENASDAMDQREARFRESSDLADATQARAEAAESDAIAAKEQAEQARDRARSAQIAAAAEAQSVVAEKTRLIGELARLQGVSVELAAQRQAGLEQRAREQAAAAAEAAQQAASRRPAGGPAGGPGSDPAGSPGRTRRQRRAEQHFDRPARRADR